MELHSNLVKQILRRTGSGSSICKLECTNWHSSSELQTPESGNPHLHSFEPPLFSSAPLWILTGESLEIRNLFTATSAAVLSYIQKRTQMNQRIIETFNSEIIRGPEDWAPRARVELLLRLAIGVADLIRLQRRMPMNRRNRSEKQGLPSGRMDGLWWR
ncbi:hypothetical protein LINPERPRIM_LOCUS12176 [Linum perenne]